MNAIRSALVLARITTLEAVRNKLLLSGVAFVLVLIGLSISAAAMSIGERSRLIVDVGLAAASAIGSIMTIALMVASFAGELTKHTAFPVLARPIPRWSFILGKYLGVVAAMSIIVSSMMVATALTVKAYGEPVPSALWAQIPLSLVEVGVVAATALLFSTLAVPALAATYVGGVVIAGNLAGQIHEAALARLAAGQSSGYALNLVFYILPDIDALSVRTRAANALPVALSYIVNGSAYGACYSACVLLLAAVVFERRKAI